MNDALIQAFENKTASEILYELSVRMWEPPLWKLYDEQLRELPAAVRIPMLVIALDTELLMQGLLGFLTNITGRYLSETIEALDAIGALSTAETMRRIRAILVRRGFTPGDRWWEIDDPARELDAEDDQLYVHLPPGKGEGVVVMLEAFIEKNANDLLHTIRACAQQS